MRVAVASGKGGTGKTTFATNLAVVLARAGRSVAYVDCDVEAPNGHVFLRPTIERDRPVTIRVPEVDLSKCDFCRECGRACRFSAIVALESKILTFPKLCHGCGGCTLACEQHAVQEVPRRIGTVESGAAGRLAVAQGRLDVGEAVSPPAIREALACAPAADTVILDAPPGTSCPVIATVKDADVVLLVTEPTPFGLSDLKLAVRMVRALRIPVAVAINRSDVGDRDVWDYCAVESLPILLDLPDDRRIAASYSRGELAIDAMPALASRFAALAHRLDDLSARKPATRRPSLPQRVPVQSAEPLPSETMATSGSPRAQEVVVISGKGGTGKTSVLASFACLTDRAVVTDCDVDAADLHHVLQPNVQQRWPFSGGFDARIDQEACTGCGECVAVCRFGAISANEFFEVDPISCEGCGVCVDCCPEHAVDLQPSTNGEWLLSETRHGPMVHAELAVAAQNSGKLVSIVRQQARAVASASGRDLVLIDGSPGIGCPVIASITGADLVLIVTEPTLSAMHDMRRVLELCRHFRVVAGLCINKADLNPELCQQLLQEATNAGVPVLGTVRYDGAFTRAQVRRESVVEHTQGPVARDLRRLWTAVLTQLERPAPDVKQIGTTARTNAMQEGNVT